jgi:hypothetical protein
MDDDVSVSIARQLADLMRENSRLRAEVHSLEGILRSSVHHREVPKGWSATLKRMRGTIEYRTIADQYAPTIAHLERSANARELHDALPKQLPSRRIN